MTLEKLLRQQLNESEPGGFHFSAGDWNVTVMTEKADSLSCSIKELALERQTKISEELGTWARRIASSVTGLLEPLSVIEVDQSLNKAILRSTTPAIREDKSYYYELLLDQSKGTLAALRRFAGTRQHAEKREVVPFVLTHDAIVKLVNDVVGKN